MGTDKGSGRIGSSFEKFVGALQLLKLGQFRDLIS
jgi:hypothetical protein